MIKKTIPYTYDCYVQALFSRKAKEENNISFLRKLFAENRKRDFAVSGKKISVFSGRKFHKEILEEAVRDSYELAIELGIKNPAVEVSSCYRISTARVSQILNEEKKEK